jgi:hypothetical protein
MLLWEGAWDALRVRYRLQPGLSAGSLVIRYHQRFDGAHANGKRLTRYELLACKLCHLLRKLAALDLVVAVSCSNTAAVEQRAYINVCLASGYYLGCRSLGSPLAFCFLDVEGSAP